MNLHQNDICGVQLQDLEGVVVVSESPPKVRLSVLHFLLKLSADT